MKIWIMSDLHCEFGTYRPPKVVADLAILAGDIGNETKGIEWAAAHLNVPTVYVAGNHEFYSCRPMERIRNAIGQTATWRGIHYLERGRVDFGYVRILGCTLWTDFGLYERPDEARRAAEKIDDFSGEIAIGDPYDPDSRPLFTPELSVAIHKASVKWLEAELAMPWENKTVVVTHHAPSMKSVSMRFLGNPINPCYASRLEHLVEQADYWIHGHMHEACSYDIGKCRVICNPRGYSEYPEDPAAPFNPELVIEL